MADFQTSFTVRLSTKFV